MYVKFEERAKGRIATFFTREKEINGEKVNNTDKSVFGTVSEGIKVGEKNGQPIWENDYWNATFCGKAYEKALTLKDKDKIVLIEMNIRNPYSSNTKKSYPQITVFDFDIYNSENRTDVNSESFVEMDENLPFN